MKLEGKKILITGGGSASVWSWPDGWLPRPYEPPARRQAEVPTQFAKRGRLVAAESLFRPMKTLGV